MFNSNSLYRTDLSRFTSIVTDRNTFKDAEMKYQVSPRINITYPITEKSNLSIAYGMYFKTPLLSNIYDNFNVSRIRSGSSLGNPNMEAEKSRQYEVAYRNQLSENFSMTITSYFKDTYNH
jgi:outer membrane receptor protein involved in Fe transport